MGRSGSRILWYVGIAIVLAGATLAVLRHLGVEEWWRGWWMAAEISLVGVAICLAVHDRMDAAAGTSDAEADEDADEE